MLFLKEKERNGDFSFLIDKSSDYLGPRKFTTDKTSEITQHSHGVATAMAAPGMLN